MFRLDAQKSHKHHVQKDAHKQRFVWMPLWYAHIQEPFIEMNHLLNSFSRLSVWAGGFLVPYKENGSCGRYGNAPDCGSG